MKKLLLILLSFCLLLTFVACGETVSVTGASVDENGDLIVTFSDGTTQNAGKVKGEKGDKGDNGDADSENPQRLDFYPLPDGTWTVSAGKSIYLEEVTIPATYKGKAVTCIGALENFDNVDELGGSWVNIKRITIPDGVTSIGKSAFISCRSLESVTIPSSVTSIGQWAFCYCSSLASITIPSSVTSIGAYAFGSCSSLASVTIPSSVTSIGYSAFNGCSNLSNIYFGGTEAQWNAISAEASIPQSATVTYNYTA